MFTRFAKRRGRCYVSVMINSLPGDLCNLNAISKSSTCAERFILISMYNKEVILKDGWLTIKYKYRHVVFSSSNVCFYKPHPCALKAQPQKARNVVACQIP